MALAIHKDVMNVVTKAKKDMPKFMTPGRLRLIHALFQELDADSEMTLDFNEVYVLMQYSMAVLFEIDTSREECEAMFHLLVRRGPTSETKRNKSYVVIEGGGSNNVCTSLFVV